MTDPVNAEDDLVERVTLAVTGLCGLHDKMCKAVRASRPYPVSIRLGASDTDAVLKAAIALEHSRAALEAATRDGEIERALSGCEGIESGPNGRGGMRVVAHFAKPGDEFALFHLLNQGTPNVG